MFELTIETTFSSAHNLRQYSGDCERLHGHNWRVELKVEADTLDERGLAVDFKYLKSELGEVVDLLDHRYLNDVPPFDTINPSAENLAKYLYGALAGRLNDGNVRLKLIRVWESDHASAAYYED